MTGTRSRREQALLLARTVRLLRPAQVAHRVRLRAQRAVVGGLPEELVTRALPRVSSAPGWPASFEPLGARLSEGFPGPTENGQGRFLFLGVTRELGDPSDWDQLDAAQLWRFHLHYFEWAWSFGTHADAEWARSAFLRLWSSWRRSSPLGRGDAWSPYVASLRAWALCGVFRALVAGSAAEAEFLRSLSLHAAYLRAHQESDVGGNHLLKNFKALVGLGTFLGDRAMVSRARTRLVGQLAVQVLADGGHYERSPSYHCDVLGDLVDLRRLLEATGESAPPALDDAIARMQGWLGALRLPDGDVPLFNDCVLVGAERMAVLEPAPVPARRLVVLEPSGYVVIRPEEGTVLVVDVGLPCPPDLPAHAHADCLSFELAVEGQRVVVDSGTSTYEPGPRRAFERSTCAHNTVEVDGADQTEVWGTFRAARRAVPRLERADEDRGVVEVVACHDGYRRLPGRPNHRRTFKVSRGRVEIADEVTGGGRHHVVSRLHLGPELRPERLAAGTVAAGPLQIAAWPPGAELAVVPTEVATGFGRLRPAHVVELRVDGLLPVRFGWTLSVGGSATRRRSEGRG